MTARSIDISPIRAEDIVMGHRERTLQLLWTIIFNFQVSLLIMNTAEPDLTATEMFAFPSKSSRNKNDSDPMIAIP